MVFGAMIVKHVEGLSDEKTIQENPYMQYKDYHVNCYNHPLGRPPKDETTATLRTRRGPSARGAKWRPHSELPKGFTGQTTSGRNLTTWLTHE